MNIFNKFLFIFAVLAFIFIVGELFYLVYIGRLSTDSKSSMPAIPSKSVSSKAMILAAVDYFSKTDNDKRAVDGSSIAQLLYAKKSILTSSIVTNIYKGKIMKISIKNGNANGFVYEATILIQGTDGQLEQHAYNRNDLDKMEVTELTKGKEKPIKMMDLKLEDIVTITHIINLQKDANSNALSLKIMKIK